MPPSQTDSPGKLCPPPRTAITSPVCLANLTRRDHVGHAGAARDQRGRPIDRPVPDPAVLVVGWVRRLDELSPEGAFELAQGRGVDLRLEAIVLMPFLNVVPAGSVVNAPRPANA